MKSNTGKALAALAAMALCAPAEAQTMYKCGRQYQDRPCDAGQQGKVVGGAAPSQAAPKPGADAECAQRGSAALNIIWAREGGATAERQLSGIEEKNIPFLIQPDNAIPHLVNNSFYPAFFKLRFGKITILIFI